MKLPNSGTIDSTNKYKLLAIIIAVAALVALPFLIESDYIKHLLIMACIGTVLGMTFSMLFSTGLITLGAGAFYWAAKVAGLGAGNPAAVTFEIGTTYLVAAGLMNYLVAFHAYETARGIRHA